MRPRVAFVLPNLFTFASLFCGFFAVAQSFGASDRDGLLAAAMAILFGAVFDACDGRVARLTRTESALGVQLDSLADLVTFGVAPACLAYNWGLHELGPAGLIICFGWLGAGAFRLARFNVLAAQGKSSGPYFRGLPIPMAASVLVSLLVAAGSAAYLAPVVLGLSYLMVSGIRFPSFKKVRWKSRRTVGVALLVVLTSLALWVNLRGAWVFLGLNLFYLALGLIEIFRKAPDDAAQRPV